MARPCTKNELTMRSTSQDHPYGGDNESYGRYLVPLPPPPDGSVPPRLYHNPNRDRTSLNSGNGPSSQYTPQQFGRSNSAPYQSHLSQWQHEQQPSRWVNDQNHVNGGNSHYNFEYNGNQINNHSHHNNNNISSRNNGPILSSMNSHQQPYRLTKEESLYEYDAPRMRHIDDDEDARSESMYSTRSNGHEARNHSLSHENRQFCHSQSSQDLPSSLPSSIPMNRGGGISQPPQQSSMAPSMPPSPLIDDHFLDGLKVISSQTGFESFDEVSFEMEMINHIRNKAAYICDKQLPPNNDNILEIAQDIVHATTFIETLRNSSNLSRLCKELDMKRSSDDSSSSSLQQQQQQNHYHHLSLNDQFDDSRINHEDIGDEYGVRRVGGDGYGDRRGGGGGGGGGGYGDRRSSGGDGYGDRRSGGGGDGYGDRRGGADEYGDRRSGGGDGYGDRRGGGGGGGLGSILFDMESSSLTSTSRRLKSLLLEARREAINLSQIIANNAKLHAREVLKRLVVEAQKAGPATMVTLLKACPENVYVQEQGWRILGDFASSDSSPAAMKTRGKIVKDTPHLSVAMSPSQQPQMNKTATSSSSFASLDMKGKVSSNNEGIESLSKINNEANESHYLEENNSNNNHSGLTTPPTRKSGSFKEEHESSSSSFPFYETIAEELGALGACELLVQTMVKHCTKVSIQCWCCRCLYLLATDCVENHLKLGKSGACEALVQTLRNYPNQRDIAGYGCLAVAHLAWQQTNRDRLLGMGCEATLETALLAFQDDQDGLLDVIGKAQRQLAGDPALCSIM